MGRNLPEIRQFRQEQHCHKLSCAAAADRETPPCVEGISAVWGFRRQKNRTCAIFSDFFLMRVEQTPRPQASLKIHKMLIINVLKIVNKSQKQPTIHACQFALVSAFRKRANYLLPLLLGAIFYRGKTPPNPVV